MENKVTPSTNRTTRRKSSSRKSLSSSATKLIRLMMQKEKQRKLNHYRNAKQKRAEAFESRRQFNPTNDNDDEEEQNETTTNRVENDNSLVSLDIESDENDTTANNNDITIRAAAELVSEASSSKPSSFNEPSKSTTIGARIGSSIANRFNSIKNSLKKIVSSSSRREINQLTTDAATNPTSKSSAVRSLIQHPAIKQTNVIRNQVVNVTHTTQSKSKELHESSLINNKPTTTIQKSSMNLRPKEITNIKSNLCRSNSMNQVNNNRLGRQLAVAEAKKYDNLKSCNWKNAQPNMTSTILASHNNSTISNTSTLSTTRGGMNSSTSSLNKPAFKLSTKIQYNDRDLYSNEYMKTAELHNSKYIKLKENRKIAYMGSTASLY